MFLRQLEYLVALAQEQHFSRAARHCNVSQPSLSNAIKQLENEFGTPIVLRHQRFQGFTAEGSRIVEWSKRILADRDAMLQELAVLKQNLSGRIRLGAMPTSSPVLPHINAHFLALHPGVQVEVSFLGLEELRVKLINFELDVGITYIDQKQPAPPPRGPRPPTCRFVCSRRTCTSARSSTLRSLPSGRIRSRRSNRIRSSISRFTP